MGALTDKYCIVGVGETPHMRPSNRTTLSMACEAVSKALLDAGLKPSDIDGMTSYQAGDSTTSAHVGTSLGIRLNYSLDILGGGSSTEALVAHAIVSRRDWSNIRAVVSGAPVGTRRPIAVVVRTVKTVPIEWRGTTGPSRAYLEGKAARCQRANRKHPHCC